LNSASKIAVSSVRLRAAAAVCLFAVLAFPSSSVSQTTEFQKAFYQAVEALRNGRLDEASAGFSRAITLSPTFAEAYFNLGLVQLQQGSPAAAQTSLQKSLALKPKLRGANLFLGIARYRMNDYADAISALKRETAIDPANSKVYMWLGVSQLAAGDANSACVSLDRAAALSPTDVDILYHRGRAHMLVSKESYEKMYQANPTSWRVHQVLAQSFVEQDRLDEAVKECQEAIAAMPREPGLHEELADVYWKQNQLPKAEAEFQNELQVDNESLSSMYKLGVVSIERSKPEVAEKLLTEVVKRSPKYPDANYQLGRAEAQMGNTVAAIADFSAAVANEKADAETLRQSYYQLAQLYRREQKTQESQAALEAFMRLKQQADARQATKLQDKLNRSSEMQNSPQ
jgi:tetratricopeptide (TPR) repeat protein